MKVRLYLALSVLALLGIIAAQNFSQLTVRFLVWSMQIPQALLIVSCGGIGLLVGLLLGAAKQKNPCD
ncbi:MAG: lipopolysaccharide assembly protein LapA domain-containing protein [Candidatus Didemnitutus sp.]|nr:lipopolysaccharide assembly protein LapA domain-containing protein [Candidatus Didemnitutus sp.]